MATYGIPDDVFEAATHAGKEAKRDYLATHPEPISTDYTCPKCGASVGEACEIRPTRFERIYGRHPGDVPGNDRKLRSHKARHAKSIRAFNKRQWNAIQVDDDAFNAYIKAQIKEHD